MYWIWLQNDGHWGEELYPKQAAQPKDALSIKDEQEPSPIVPKDPDSGAAAPLIFSAL